MISWYFAEQYSMTALALSPLPKKWLSGLQNRVIDWDANKLLDNYCLTVVNSKHEIPFGYSL